MKEEAILLGPLHSLVGVYQPPEDAFEIPDLLDLLLPVFRDDIALVDHYAYYAEPPLSCATDAYIGAHDDRSTSVEAARRWRDQTDGPFALTVLPGRYFFLHDALRELQRNVAARLQAVIGERR